VIHRDLKPSNILVDEQGEPRVLDFGLAKFSPDGPDAPHGATLTEEGQFLGTVPWAAPEQVAGDPHRIDVRTDVYSLGVLLFNLLTGQFPYDTSSGAPGLRKQILFAPPMRPSVAIRDERREDELVARSTGAPLWRRVASRLRHRASVIDDDIDTITVRCLAKDNERRYQSAGELARDVRRYLAGESIEAKRDSGWYLLWRFCRRHWLPSSLTALTCLLLLTLAITFAALSHRTKLALQRAERESDVARRISDFHRDALLGIHPSLLGTEVRLRDVIGQAIPLIDVVFADAPEVAAEQHATFAKCLYLLSRLEECALEWRRAYELRRAAMGATHPDTIDTLGELAYALQKTGRLLEALECATLAAGSAAEAFGSNHAASIHFHVLRADLLVDVGKFAEAEPVFSENVERAVRVLGAEHGLTRYALTARASFWLRSRRYLEAERALRDILALQMRVNGAEASETQCALNHLVLFLRAAGRNEEALGLAEGAYAAQRERLGQEFLWTLQGALNLACLLPHAGRHREADELFQETIALHRRVYGDSHRHTATCLRDYGLFLLDCKRLIEAEAVLREAVSMGERAYPWTNVYQGENLMALARCLDALEERVEAPALRAAAAEVAERELGRPFP
jgi:tetratricopeptide (TPR) repeat protein